MPRRLQFLSRPATWFAAYALWFVLLFLLSSITVEAKGKPSIPHLDKVAHATYFTAGSAALGIGLLLGGSKLARSRHQRWLLLTLVLAALVVGGFDEWHQSFTAGRSGNDLGDLAADLLGGVVGFFVATRLFGFATTRGLLARLAA